MAPDSPAAKAGLKSNDVVTAWDDHAIEDPNLLRLLAARTKVGTTVKVTVPRNGEELKLDITVAERLAQLRQ